MRAESLIDRALEVARTAHPADVPVGAVVVDASGRELACATNAREALGDPTAHAEVLALRAAAGIQQGEHADRGWRLEGCTLAVTLEPCTMCAGAAVLARVDRVVFGAWEPKTGAAGSLWDVLRDRRLTHRPEVIGGVREQACSDLLRDWFRGAAGPGGPDR
ncbi:nucleoside deaminase [Actinomycetospora sp. CA-084318]|uniref:nucleoside deaminase n=1 Tax=Actinomycetospora sp. CA-084318 TaxID=3239892 RepID=UPI003D97D3D5